MAANWSVQLCCVDGGSVPVESFLECGLGFPYVLYPTNSASDEIYNISGSACDVTLGPVPCCVQSISNSLKIVCGKEREDDEWNPWLTYTLEELKPSELSNLGITLLYVSTAMRMTACGTPDPCLNGGTRIVEDGVYRCLCAGNHVGQYCQSCRVDWKLPPQSDFFFSALAPLFGKTRISFKVRGRTRYISMKLKSRYYAVFGVCIGKYRQATINMMKDGQRAPTKKSNPLPVQCDPSGFDSYWIEKTNSHFFQLGLGGNSTPVVKKLWDRKEVALSIGLSVNSGTEWIVDHPCFH
ncbi:uncharacterized protein LOC121416758 [Lytechinus variegatus]|uniref:uncharacterized protein LOC121416758 n=1 Tax=Lytechinus variegatus TaxID=7654 RepID=UPI001BB17DEC|nr:uncharacterized protein LOC121416758 [Lytechinus variegatus]